MLGRSSGQLAHEHQLAQEQQVIAESEAAVREAEAAAAERAAEQYATLGSYPATCDDLVSRLADLARLHDSGALSAAEFEAAKARLLDP